MLSKHLSLTTLIHFCIPARYASADVIIDWNNQLLQTIRTTSTNPPRASRAMAMVHTAVYDAVNSIDDTHLPYHFNGNVSPATSREAAAAQAAHDVLTNLFPAQSADFDALLATHLATVPGGLAKTDGIHTGSGAAAAILALRANDHSNDSLPYTPSGRLGRWEPTPPGFAAALLPQWPTVTGWAITNGAQFRDSTGPPSLTDLEYARDFNEVKELGSATSSTRTADQTDIARFWADGAGTATPPGHWNIVAQGVAQSLGNSLSENARLFALLNIATADAACVAWDNKYAYDFWRPITAIQNADLDGNPDTASDAGWKPLLDTPPFPSYTSGHSTFSAAAATVLAEFFGTDNIAFTTSAEGGVAPDRSFTSFSQAAEEAGRSRIYGGIHYQFDNEDALRAGAELGRFVMDTQLLAVPEPSSGIPCLLAMLGVFVPHRYWHSDLRSRAKSRTSVSVTERATPCKHRTAAIDWLTGTFLNSSSCRGHDEFECRARRDRAAGAVSTRRPRSGSPVV
jgi:hypothetical protein